MTFALTLALTCIAAGIVAIFELGSVAAFLLLSVVIVLVKVISKRPEFDGLPPPRPK